MGLACRNEIKNVSPDHYAIIAIVENLFIKGTEFCLFTISYGVNLFKGSGFKLNRKKLLKLYRIVVCTYNSIFCDVQ
jgi:hypothetical protein